MEVVRGSSKQREEVGRNGVRMGTFQDPVFVMLLRKEEEVREESA